MFKKLLNIIRKNKIVAILILEILFLYIININSIISGFVPFWYDEARDLLSAVDNLKKITLIGPPTGIPGFFYGPYWIWILSIPLIVSKDPRVVTLFVTAIPYLIIFPYILFKFRKIIDIKIILALFLTFLIGFNEYILMLWNPNLASLLILLLIYLVVFMNSSNLLKIYGQVLLSGIISGLVLSFTMSFGLGVLLGSLVFLFIELLKEIFNNKKNRILNIGIGFSKILIFLFGVFIVFTPFFIFEFRHGFNQIQAAYKTIIDSTFYNSAAVGVTGLSKIDILRFFFGILGKVLDIPSIIYLPLYVFLIIYLFKVFRRKISLKKEEKRLLLFLVSISGGVLYIYLTSKNPVWAYHFIGAEIIFILLIGVIVNKLSYLKNVIFLWIMVLFIFNFVSFVKDFKSDRYKIDSLLTKEYTVNQIVKNAGDKQFSVFAYNPAIYTFDYDYLFNWYAGEDVKLQKDVEKAQYIYLIIPKVSEAIKKDFINYKTSNAKYENVETWMNPDGTQVIKRRLKNNSKKNNL